MNKILIVCCCLLCGISGLFSGCTTIDDQLEIQQFRSNPTICDAGENVTLTWMVTGATTVLLDQNIGSVDPIGSKTIFINETTSFTLTASNENETITKTIIVYVKGTSFPEDILIDSDAYTEAPRDSFTVKYLFIYDDFLEVVVQYSGGCEIHNFSLIAQEEFMESYPVQVNIVLSHDANNDPCDAWITKAIRFDLTLLKQLWQTMYQQESGEISIILEDYEQPIPYEFTFPLFSSLNITLRTDKEIYNITDSIMIRLMVENTAQSDIDIEFPDSQVADFHWKNLQDEVLYTWSDDKMFASVITPVTFPSDTIIELFNISWDLTDLDADIKEPGDYILQGWIPNFYYTDSQDDNKTKMSSKLYSNALKITIT